VGPVTVAALFVQSAGVYSQIPGVDLWDAERDAVRYTGPHPCVAHPPCKRWGRFWWADGSEAAGDDGGLFESALRSVRAWGGVLEHPASSVAWPRFSLPPATVGAWSRGICGGWSTEVPQRNYGHRAIKLTWLYAFGVTPPPLDWSEPEPPEGWLSQRGRCSGDRPRPTCPCERCEAIYGAAWRGQSNRGLPRLTAKENAATPRAFADLLVSIARGGGQ
jgi:hypothetical protein